MEVDAIWSGPLGPPRLRPGERGEAERALQAYHGMPRGSSPDHVAKLMATAAIGYPALRLSSGEADMRLKLYQGELFDIHGDVLAEAFRMAVRELRFFPTIAELRAFAKRVPTPRRFVVMRRLEQLLARAASADVGDEDLVRPEQLAGLISRLQGSFTA